MKLEEFNGTYGSGYTSSTILTAKERNGLTWYCIEGSLTVNATYNEITDGTHVEYIDDVDCFTWSKPIETLEELENAVES